MEEENVDILDQVISASNTSADNLDDLGQQLEDLQQLSADGDFAAIVGGYLQERSSGATQVVVQFELPNGETFEDEWDVPMFWKGDSQLEKLITSLGVTPTKSGLPEVLNRRVPVEADPDGGWQVNESDTIAGNWIQYDNPLYDKHYGTVTAEATNEETEEES